MVAVTWEQAGELAMHVGGAGISKVRAKALGLECV